ncbi:secreted protein [Colletotrichum tofieldiae]|nr:secreted protein [Colletotrichum tofieldiae]GKT72581.1 secreted protein [Colletotrichum tofieldiae]
MVLDHTSLDDITGLVSKATGALTTKFPPSEDARFTIFAFYQKLSGNKNLKFESNSSSTLWDNGSYTVDHFSAQGARVTTDFWEKYILDDQVTTKLKEVGNYARFIKKFGYDLKPFLPLIIFGNNNLILQGDAPGKLQVLLDQQEMGQGFVNDYRAALAEGYQEYLKTLQEWLKSVLSLQLSVQPSYNLPMDMLASIPFVDAPESESLQGQNKVDSYRNFAGPAYLSGKKITSNELGASFARAFNLAIPELLQMANRGFSGGLNQFVIHGQSYTGNYPATTWPGNAPFRYVVSDLWNSKRPDWDNGLAYALDYMARLQYVQRQGIPRTDVVIYNKHSATDGYLPVVYTANDLTQGGWSYNYLSPDNFNQPEVSINKSILAPSGPAYKAMVILATHNVTLEAVEKLQSFAQQGLPIIVAGGTPGYYPTSNASTKAAVESAVSKLLLSNNVHQVASGGVAEKLMSLGLRPNVGTRTNGTWHTTWRTDSEGGVDYLYVFCDGPPSSGELTVKSTKTIYILNAWTGVRSPLLNYAIDGNYTTIPVSLAANQTLVLAFEEQPIEGLNLPEVHATKLPTDVLGYGIDESSMYLHVAGNSTSRAKFSSGKEINLNSTAPEAFELRNWDLIAEHWEAPEDMYQASVVAVKRNTTHTLDKLVSWTEIEGLQNTSGVGYYVANFTWPQSPGSTSGAYVRFPAALNAIVLHVNGQRTPPLDYANPIMDISPYLVKGRNEITASVPSTLWNYIRSIWDSLENGGLEPLLPILLPRTANGLVGTVRIIPFQKIRVQ